MAERPELPSAYPGHPHAGREARQIAQKGMILLAEVGSGVHGTSLPGTDDTDFMGVCIEPPEYVTGLRSFEQFERHTAWDRAGGARERSGAGDVDALVYGARKFCRLAVAGNPSILTLLFVPPSSVAYESRLGRELLDLAPAFVSLSAADRYLGYLRAQKDGMTGRGRTNRPELIEKYGYDCKFAAHAVRLGIQGVELMETGRITLPIEPSWRKYLVAIRRGEEPLWSVQGLLRSLEGKLGRIREDNPYRMCEDPDLDRVNDWLFHAYQEAWGTLSRA